MGAALYFLLVVSVLPRCGMANVLQSPGPLAAAGAFLAQVGEALQDLCARGVVSLVTLVVLAVGMVKFAQGGGVGALSAQAGRRVPHATPPLRLGGAAAVVGVGLQHAATHLVTAVVLACLLELGIELW